MTERDEASLWQEYRLGIIVTTVAVLVTLFVFFLGAGPSPFVPDMIPYYVNLDDAGGVRVGSPVEIAGVAAGEVTDIEIVPAGVAPPRIAEGDPLEMRADVRDIRLEIQISEDFQEQVTPSSRAQLANLGLGAERYVKISAGDVREEPLEPRATIRTVASIDWDLVLTKLARALNETNEIVYLTDQIRGKVFERPAGTLGLAIRPDSPLYGGMQGLIDESEALLTLLDEGEGVVGQWRRDGRLKESVERLDENVEVLGRAINDSLGPLRRWSEPTELRTALADLRRDIEDLQARLESGRGSGGRLLNDEELFAQIRVLQSRIAEFMAAFRDDPLGFVNIDVF